MFCLFLIAINYMTITQVTTLTTIVESNIVKEGKQHYLLLDNRKLELDKKLVEDIHFGEEYTVDYYYTYINKTGGEIDKFHYGSRVQDAVK